MSGGCHAAAVELIGCAGIVEQDLVKLQQAGPEIAEPDLEVVCYRRDGRRSRRRYEGPGWRSLGAQVREVQSLRHHLERSVSSARPLGARPVPIELDAVTVGVAEIECLAHAMIGGAIEGD